MNRLPRRAPNFLTRNHEDLALMMLSLQIASLILTSSSFLQYQEEPYPRENPKHSNDYTIAHAQAI